MDRKLNVEAKLLSFKLCLARGASDTHQRQANILKYINKIKSEAYSLSVINSCGLILLAILSISISLSVVTPELADEPADVPTESAEVPSDELPVPLLMGELFSGDEFPSSSGEASGEELQASAESAEHSSDKLKLLFSSSVFSRPSKNLSSYINNTKYTISDFVFMFLD